MTRERKWWLRDWSSLSVLDRAHERLSPVGDPLRGRARLLDRPVCRMSCGHIGGPGVVYQPLGEGTVQHQFTLGDGDEAIAEPVEPELRSARLADAAIDVMRILDVAGGAGRRREYPIVKSVWQVVTRSPASYPHRCCRGVPPAPAASVKRCFHIGNNSYETPMECLQVVLVGVIQNPVFQ